MKSKNKRRLPLLASYPYPLKHKQNKMKDYIVVVALPCNTFFFSLFVFNFDRQSHFYCVISSTVTKPLLTRAIVHELLTVY